MIGHSNQNFGEFADFLHNVDVQLIAQRRSISHSRIILRHTIVIFPNSMTNVIYKTTFRIA